MQETPNPVSHVVHKHGRGGFGALCLPRYRLSYNFNYGKSGRVSSCSDYSIWCRKSIRVVPDFDSSRYSIPPRKWKLLAFAMRLRSFEDSLALSPANLLFALQDFRVCKVAIFVDASVHSCSRKLIWGLLPITEFIESHKQKGKVITPSTQRLCPTRPFAITGWQPTPRALPRRLPSDFLQYSGRFASRARG